MLRQTHTFAEMEVSTLTFTEICGRLKDADYQHAIMEDGGRVVLDMHGIALTSENVGATIEGFYVCGFMFNPERTAVLLVRKKKPAWQAGKLNGIGGGIEDGESPTDAMVREFLEETGVQTFEDDWACTVLLEHGKNFVWFFRSISPMFYGPKHGSSHEDIVQTNLDWLVASSEDRIMKNLRWLVPLSNDDDVAFPIRVVDRTTPGDMERKG